MSLCAGKAMALVVRAGKGMGDRSIALHRAGRSLMLASYLSTDRLLCLHHIDVLDIASRRFATGGGK